MKEIIDVDFLPSLDDEDFKKEKNQEQTLIEDKAYNEIIKEYEENTQDNESFQETKAQDEYEKIHEQNTSSWNESIEGQQKNAESRDTSYASFNTAQKQAFKRKKKKISGYIINGILLALVLLMGAPIVSFGGFFVVMGIGMALFACGMAVGMGVLGLGLASFTAVAGMGQVAMLSFFGSLLMLGGGGIGLCLMLMLFIWVKRLVVRGYKYLKNRDEKGVA